MPWAVRTTQLIGDRRGLDIHLLRLGVELRHRWGEHNIRQPPELLAVFRESTRITGEILARPELERIDENAHDHALAMASRQANQREMPVMQVAHGRNEGDGGFAPQPVAQLLNGINDLHAENPLAYRGGKARKPPRRRIKNNALAPGIPRFSPLDSMRYWVREMHVDGFRFDLASVFARNPDGTINFEDPPIFGDISSDPDFDRVR